MVEIRFSFFSPSIFSFGKAMTHNICCFCQHMILFSNFGREIYSSFYRLKSVRAVIVFFPVFFLESVLDRLLSLHPVLLPICLLTWIWSFAIFWHVGFERMRFTVDVLSELIHCKVFHHLSSFTHSRRLCRRNHTFIFSVPISLLLSNNPDAPGRLRDWPKIWQNITADHRLWVCKHLAEHLMRSW